MVLSNLIAPKAGAPRSAFSSRLRSGMFEPGCVFPVDRPGGACFASCAAVVSLALFNTGCLFHKKQQARVFVPPPPRRLNTANLKLPPVSDAPDIVVEDVD